jgi:hypothetical protein
MDTNNINHIFQLIDLHNTELVCEAINKTQSQELITGFDEVKNMPLLDKIILNGNAKILKSYLDKVKINKEKENNNYFSMIEDNFNTNRYEMFSLLFNAGLKMSEQEKENVIISLSQFIQDVSEEEENNYYQIFEDLLINHENIKINPCSVMLIHLFNLADTLSFDKAMSNITRMYHLLEKYTDTNNFVNRLEKLSEKMTLSMTYSSKALNYFDCYNQLISYLNKNEERKNLESQLKETVGIKENKKMKL